MMATIPIIRLADLAPGRVGWVEDRFTQRRYLSQITFVCAEKGFVHVTDERGIAGHRDYFEVQLPTFAPPTLNTSRHKPAATRQASRYSSLNVD